MEDKYRKTDISVSLINYHFVFCPRYRRKIFLDSKVEQRFKQLATLICLDSGIEIVSIECESDITHMVLSCLPSLSPLDVMNKIKVATSKGLKNEFEHLEKMPSVWTRKFFVSTEEILCKEVIKEYVENQRKRY